MESHLQKNDDKVFGKKFGSQIEDTERSKKKTLEVFLPALSKNPFRTDPHKLKQLVRWRVTLLHEQTGSSRQKQSLTEHYSSTDNFLSPILISDWLIFFFGNLILCQKRNENDKNTNFMKKKNKKKKKKGVA